MLQQRADVFEAAAPQEAQQQLRFGLAEVDQGAPHPRGRSTSSYPLRSRRSALTCAARWAKPIAGCEAAFTEGAPALRWVNFLLRTNLSTAVRRRYAHSQHGIDLDFLQHDWAVL